MVGGIVTVMSTATVKNMGGCCSAGGYYSDTAAAAVLSLATVPLFVTVRRLLQYASIIIIVYNTPPWMPITKGYASLKPY